MLSFFLSFFPLLTCWCASLSMIALPSGEMSPATTFCSGSLPTRSATTGLDSSPLAPRRSDGKANLPDQQQRALSKLPTDL